MSSPSNVKDELHNLRRIIGKAFRKAKCWYVGYLLGQAAVLVFAVVSVFAQLNPNLSAVVAFLCVIATEGIRWRSDFWKSEGESAKRRWEKADGFGQSIDTREIADWLAAKPGGFLKDVGQSETKGSEFDSDVPPGPRRATENTQESAWWSKHLSRRLVVYLGFALLVVVLAAFLALTLSIASLKVAKVQQTGSVIQNVGGIICAVLAFMFSINLVRLLVEFWAFASAAEETLRRCAELLRSSTITETDALSIMHDYQTARNSAPLLPTFVWHFHSTHLREQWAFFRPKANQGEAIQTSQPGI